MTFLLENPLPIWIAGAIGAVLAGVVFAARRNLASLVALAGIVLVTLLLAGIETHIHRCCRFNVRGQVSKRSHRF